MNIGGFDHTNLYIAKQDGRSAVRLYTAEPTPLEQRNLGTLFAICEIDSRESTNEEILTLLIDELHTAYYASEAIEADSAFEHALHKVNERIAEIVGEVGDDWLKRCNMILGIHKEHHLVFTHIGSVLGMMFVKEQLVEIIEPSARVQELNPMKFFSNIVAGDMPEKGVLLFATDSMMDYLSKETVRRIITGNKAGKAARELTELLSIDTGDRNFAGMILTPSAHPFGVAEPSTTTSAAPGLMGGLEGNGVRGHSAVTASDQPGIALHSDSMTSLVHREQQTAELLNSSLWPSLKKGVAELFGKKAGGENPSGNSMVQALHTSPEPMQEEEIMPEEEALIHEPSATQFQSQPQTPSTQSLPSSHTRNTHSTRAINGTSSSPSAGAGQFASQLLKGIGMIIVQIATILQAIVAQLFDILKSLYFRARGKYQHAPSAPGGSRNRAHRGRNASLKQSIGSVIGGLLQWFSRLSIAQKGFVVVALVVFVIFAQSVVSRGGENASRSEEQRYAEIINQVDVKLNEGKAAELVNSDSRASYVAARDLLAQIPKDSNTYKERGAELERIIHEEIQRTNKVRDLGTLSPVLDFASISSSLQVKNMILLGASVYAFDANNGSVYRGNLENSGTTVALSNSAGDARILSASKASPGTGAVVQPNNIVGTFSPLSDDIVSMPLSFGTPAQNITDVSVFGTRVYTLDTGTNQIVRNRQEGTNTYSGGENWLTDVDANIRNAVSMAIDGSIYILKNNGQVEKYDSGVRDTDFALSTVDPALDSAVAFYTDENTTNIYIADAKNRRVVVFDKKGMLVQQYASESFDGLTDIIVEEAEKRFFVLTENGKVFKIDL